MLIVVHKGREEEVKRIFDKWDLPWAEIGMVTDTGRMKVRHTANSSWTFPAENRRRIARLSARVRRTRVPRGGPRLPSRRPSPTRRSRRRFEKLLAWPSIASKNWVYRQYDHMVRDGSVVLPRQRCGRHPHQGRFLAP
jgi:phosphoribosylformylglycinamidine (FGAM) synthase-like enzyme